MASRQDVVREEVQSALGEAHPTVGRSHVSHVPRRGVLKAQTVFSPTAFNILLLIFGSIPNLSFSVLPLSAVMWLSQRPKQVQLLLSNGECLSPHKVPRARHIGNELAGPLPVAVSLSSPLWLQVLVRFPCHLQPSPMAISWPFLQDGPTGTLLLWAHDPHGGASDTHPDPPYWWELTP